MGEHRIFIGFGQSVERREAFQEPLVVGDDGFDAGLLEHHLGDPNRVRVARVTPGKVATGFVVPAEERAPDRVHQRNS